MWVKIMEFWRFIQRRLHSESALHYPKNKVRLILKAYVDGILNQYLEDARVFAEQGFLLTCIGSYLDERGNEMNLPRKKGNIARGTVNFTLSEPSNSKLKIPRNTLMLSIYGYEYITLNDAYIGVGETTTTVNVQAITYGKRYNIDAKELTIIDNTRLSSELEVSNEIPITGGTDGETDEEYRKRIFNAYSPRLTVDYLKKQGIIIYSKKEFEEDIRTKMTSLNPYLNNVYAGIPPNEEIADFLDNDVIHNKHIYIYTKGWD